MSQDDIRLSGTSYAVLGLIKYLGRATPYELKRAIEASVENFWPVPHTTFYAEPERLAGAGLLTEEREPGGRRRKIYEITEAGRAALGEWLSSAETAVPQVRDEGTLKIFCGADPVPIHEAQLEWHRTKLSELESYLENIDAAHRRRKSFELGGGDPATLVGIRNSLLVGTSYHRLNIEALETLLS